MPLGVPARSEVCTSTPTSVRAIDCRGDLKTLHLDDLRTVRTRVVSMIGAEPRTAWLDGCCALDAKGFVLTGPDARAAADFGDHRDQEREPFLLETSRPGVLAVGDCRACSVDVATAVGEGALAVESVHELLAVG